MRYHYAATHLNERYANSGATARRIHVFATKAGRDRFVRDYVTNDCEAVRYAALSRAEREAADAVHVED